jgi:hypothetical protein
MIFAWEEYLFVQLVLIHHSCGAHQLPGDNSHPIMMMVTTITTG